MQFVNELNQIELNISKHQLIQNVQKIKKLSGPETKVMIISKANAYGLGAALVCPVIAPYVDYFGVATLNEALEIRSVCPNSKITLLSEPRKSDIKILAKYHINCGLYSKNSIDNLNDYLQQHPDQVIETHFKVNTGLNRLGNNLNLDLFQNAELDQNNATLAAPVAVNAPETPNFETEFFSGKSVSLPSSPMSDRKSQDSSADSGLNTTDGSIESNLNNLNLSGNSPCPPDFQVSAHSMNSMSASKNLIHYWLDNTVENLKKVSLWSHLQNSELHEENDRINKIQLKNFHTLTDQIISDPKYEKYGLLRHLSNSYALEYLNPRSSSPGDMSDYKFDMVRGGICMWENTFELKVQIKHIFTPQNNTTVGYGCTEITPNKYICNGQHRAAALAIGYADGLSTKLRGSGYVVAVDNQTGEHVKCDIISSVMMDMTMIKIPENLNVEAEDWVYFIGKENNEFGAMTIADISKYTEENSRELMVHFGRRMNRRIV